MLVHTVMKHKNCKWVIFPVYISNVCIVETNASRINWYKQNYAKEVFAYIIRLYTLARLSVMIGVL